MKFQMKERRRRGPWVFLLLILSLLLIGCTNPDVIYINRTIYNDSCIPVIINNTITINNTIPYNLTCLEPEIESTVYDRQYVLGLIRQLKHYEKVQDRFVNQSSCMNDLNRTEYKLKERELELCYNWNSSWC